MINNNNCNCLFQLTLAFPYSWHSWLSWCQRNKEDNAIWLFLSHLLHVAFLDPEVEWLWLVAQSMSATVKWEASKVDSKLAVYLQNVIDYRSTHHLKGRHRGAMTGWQESLRMPEFHVAVKHLRLPKRVNSGKMESNLRVLANLGHKQEHETFR